MPRFYVETQHGGEETTDCEDRVADCVVIEWRLWTVRVDEGDVFFQIAGHAFLTPDVAEVGEEAEY